MKVKKAVKVALDIAMALVFVAIMATALVQEAPHEWLGVTLFVLMAIHIVLNRKWLASIFRGHHSALRIVQIVVIVGLAACIIGQFASSLVLSKHAFGFLPAFPGAGWARSVHMLCSYWAFVLAFAHAGLHARAPKNMAPWQKWAVRIIIAAVAYFGAFSFALLSPTTASLSRSHSPATQASRCWWRVFSIMFDRELHLSGKQDRATSRCVCAEANGAGKVKNGKAIHDR